jgi:hypothetical protein
MLRNRLYLIDKWLSVGSRTLLILLLIATSTLMINFESTMFIGIGLLLIICLWVVFIKARITGGELKFNKSYYTLPIIGETIVAQKNFKYDLNKVSNQKNYIRSKNFISIHKGLNFHIDNIEELDDNWIIELRLDKYNEVIEVFWLDVKDYFMTITDIREEKLKKILK